MASTKGDDEELRKVLQQLSLGGVESMNVDQQTLGKLNSQLPTHPGSHWYCARASEMTREAAVFLLRMLAYDGPRVNKWKENFVQCLTNCAECVVGVQEAKVQSRRTYFGAFQDATLSIFYDAFEKFEVSFIIKYLEDHELMDDLPASEKTLADISPAVVYYMLSDPRILEEPKISAAIQRHVPKHPVAGLPKIAPPVGLFVLSMAQSDDVRRWAREQLTIYTVTPMPSEHFLPVHNEALLAVTDAVHPGTISSKLTLHSPTDNADELWRAYCLFLRYIPGKSIPQSAVSAVIAHLHDTETNFLEVLRAFLLILDRKGPDVWSDQGEEYPRLVFSSIKDNVVLSKTLENLESDGMDWLINWPQLFIKSLRPSVLPSVLPLVMQFLCEGVQHERFGRTRPVALKVAAQILGIVLANDDGTPLFDMDLVWDTIDIHASTFVSIALGETDLSEQWQQARIAARKLIKLAMKTDTKHIISLVAKLAEKSPDHLPPHPPQVREQLWKKTYETILHNDPDALATIFERIATVAHMDRLVDAPWMDKLHYLKVPDEGRKILNGINHALDVFRDGYSDAISRHLDFSDSIGALELLKRPGVVKNIMLIMLSPKDELREPAQGVVGLAFDADSRTDCLRALLLNFPDASMEGVMHYLDVFNASVAILPEACSMSKALAVCLTDVIDVLCSTPNGLVHQTGFLGTFTTPGPEVVFPRWWKLMCRALAVIFQRTPRWALYFENEVMTVWMRDALIFGRDMLAQRKVIETAAGVSRQSSARRTATSVGRDMVDDLQAVLFDLIKWLRLTDEELLHQAFALLQSLLGCFRETDIKPKDTTLEKLQRYISEGRRLDPKRQNTRLDSARINRLEATIAYFIEPQVLEIDDQDEDGDSEIQMVAPTEWKKPARKPIRPEPLPAKKAVKPNAQLQQKLAWSIHAERSEPVKTKAKTFSKDDQAKLAEASSMPKFSLSKPTAPVAQPAKAVVAKPSTSAAQADESSESEEEGESLEELLRRKEPKIKKPAERRQIMMLDMPTNVLKNPVLERLSKKEEAKRVAMRLKPDISSLHRTILSWNYEDNGLHPPGVRLELSRVPDVFADIQQYRHVFEPLLLLECWAQIQNSKEEPTESYQSNVVSRQYTNDWIDLDILVSESVQKDWTLAETDIVLLKYPDGSKRHMGKVQLFKNSPMGLQATIRLKLSENDLGPQSGSVWLLSKVFSLTTLHREYAALMGLPYYDLCETVLKARLAKPAWVDDADIKRTITSYGLNEPQAKAILSALETDGFSLIQGPPGTGKTSTICGLVQTFMTRRPKPSTAIHVGRNAGTADKEPPKKILLCAPSNAAIDEITLRLKEGTSGPGRRVTPPKVVRVGAPKSMNVSIRDVSLDHLVEQKLSEDSSAKNSRQDGGSEIALVRAELEKVKRLRQDRLDEMSNIHDNTAKTLALEEEVRKLNKQKTNLTHQLDKLRDKQKSDYRALDAITRKFRAEVLFEADVICSTLSGAGHEQLEPFDFEMIVIDEAAQAIELSSLIPLRYKCGRCVMVGDPQQLPPTVISPEASSYGYNQSLFVRLQKQRPEAVHLLSIQYRMHPEISVVPSRMFYDGRLLDGPDMVEKTRKPWHANEKFGEYRFFNVKGVEEKGASHSLINRSEVQVAVALYNRLRQEYSTFDFDFKIGIVTMYRAQMRELRRAFEQRFGSNITSVVDFNTVDGFQGQEKDIIILSCVRAGPNLQKVGFLADIRRMNVALTRAKSSVFVLGNAPSLERSDAVWKRIVQDARERSRLIDADVAYFTSSRSAPPKPIAASKPKPTSKAAEAPLPPLATPKELAAANRSLPSKPIRKTRPSDDMDVDSAQPAVDVDDAMDVDSSSPIPSVIPALPEGQSHPPHVSQSLRPQPGTLQPRNAPDEQKPRPRPAKKPKPPPSLFIPKKRPPPPSDGSGPSTNRRRI